MLRERKFFFLVFPVVCGDLKRACSLVSTEESAVVIGEIVRRKTVRFDAHPRCKKKKSTVKDCISSFYGNSGSTSLAPSPKKSFRYIKEANFLMQFALTNWVGLPFISAILCRKRVVYFNILFFFPTLNENYTLLHVMKCCVCTCCIFTLVCFFEKLQLTF